MVISLGHGKLGKVKEKFYDELCMHLVAQRLSSPKTLSRYTYDAYSPQHIADLDNSIRIHLQLHHCLIKSIENIVKLPAKHQQQLRLSIEQDLSGPDLEAFTLRILKYASLFGGFGTDWKKILPANEINIQPHEVLDVYDYIVTTRPDYRKLNAAKEQFLKGNKLFEQDKVDEALLCYNKASELDPKNGMAWWQQGACFHIKGRDEEALQSIGKALESDPLQADVWYFKAQSEERLNRIQDAIQSYHRLIEITAPYGPLEEMQNFAARAREHLLELEK